MRRRSNPATNSSPGSQMARSRSRNGAIGNGAREDPVSIRADHRPVPYAGDRAACRPCWPGLMRETDWGADYRCRQSDRPVRGRGRRRHLAGTGAASFELSGGLVKRHSRDPGPNSNAHLEALQACGRAARYRPSSISPPPPMRSPPPRLPGPPRRHHGHAQSAIASYGLHAEGRSTGPRHDAATSTVQVNLDYADEADMVKKAPPAGPPPRWLAADLHRLVRQFTLQPGAALTAFSRCASQNLDRIPTPTVRQMPCALGDGFR